MILLVMKRTSQEVSPAEVIEHLRRFLPPGQPDAFLDGAEFVVRWLPSPDAWPWTPPGFHPAEVRSTPSFDDALHRLIGQCAPIFIAYRAHREAASSGGERREITRAPDRP